MIHPFQVVPSEALVQLSVPTRVKEKVLEDSKEPEWTVSTVPSLGPYDEIVFKNGRGFKSTLRVDYRRVMNGIGDYPVIRFLEILEEYDEWRTRTNNGFAKSVFTKD